MASTAARYPLVLVTLAVGALGFVLLITGLRDGIPWLFSGFALIAASIEAVQMVKQLRAGTFGVDLLAIIAIVATVAVGEYLASMIIVLMVSGGKALEDFSRGRAQREITALLEREPQVAHRLVVGTTRVVDIAAGQVRVGDTILVRSGEVVPVDGELVSMSAGFDESSLTGESMPVQRVAGDTVLSGSINGPAAATITATTIASESQFQAIIALVKQASSNRAPVVRLADRYAIPFTGISLAIGIIAWIASGDPVRFAEVLVLATPCPLVLAAPVAFMGGMSRAAHAGIIVKGGAVLETLARIRTVVFDKTGTLTHGSPAITRILPRAPWDESQLLTLVASAERFSSHVLAASIVAAAGMRGLELMPVREASEVAARGIDAVVGERRVSVGTLAFVRERATEATATATLGSELAVYVAVDGRFAGSIVAADPVRNNAAATVAGLKRRGIVSVMMLTGDASSAADHVAREVGITTVRADCLPADKVTAMREIIARPVLMVGDGVNDAPVLAAADVGIAMGAKGATAASESADAVILVDDISLAEQAVAIGQRTVRIALQSIWLGITLSLALMLIAAFGVIPATLGAGIQEFVDLAAILNALRAVRSKI